jgi:hypothetical protein
MNVDTVQHIYNFIETMYFLQHATGFGRKGHHETSNKHKDKK